MLRTLIVGFGRAGHGLHWTVLRRLRQTPRGSALISGEPPVVYDFDPDTPELAASDIVTVPDLAGARKLLDPENTLVHLCTPPTHRLGLLKELAGLGFRRVLVEKPLAIEAEELVAIEALQKSHGLRLMVVAHWLQSALTQQLLAQIEEGELGDLQRIYVAQRKPRLVRTLQTRGHPTAFDVELPHSVGVVLRLAGDADTVGAELGDMRIENTVVPEMGTARLLLEHHAGVRTEIFSDLASPVRERVIKLDFSRGSVVGHYPISETDNFAHLSTSVDGARTDSIFRDDSLGRFLLHAYEQFAKGAGLGGDFRLNARVTTLLAEAKKQARLARPTAAGAYEFPENMESEALSHA